MNAYMAEKWICVEPKQLGESSAERNRKLRLRKGTRKRRRQRTQDKGRSSIGINQENITIGRKKIISPFKKPDFTSAQLLKSIPLFASGDSIFKIKTNAILC